MAKPLPVPGVAPEDSLLSNAARMLPIRVTELTAWEIHADDRDRVYELHQMRIAAKRLRYTMELFAPFYDAAFAAAIDRVKAIQEHLGQIHDADVLVPQLEAHLIEGLNRGRKRRPPVGVHATDFDSAAGLLALCLRKRDERDQAYRAFLDEWKAMRADGFFEALLAQVRAAALSPEATPASGALGEDSDSAGGSSKETHHG